MKLIDELRNRLTPKTPADRERVKKIAVYTVLCLSCLVCIWLIFAPSGDDEAVAGKANTELPDGTTDGIPDSKIAAYQQAAQNKEKETRQAQLESISATLDTVATQSTTDMPDAIQSSADAYQQAQASLQDFYISEPSGEAQQVAELQERIAELEMQQAMPDYNHKSPDEMELLERSYQLAANIWAMATVAITSLHSRRRKKKANAMSCPLHRSAAMSFHRSDHLPTVGSTPRSEYKRHQARTPFPQWSPTTKLSPTVSPSD